MSLKSKIANDRLRRILHPEMLNNPQFLFWEGATLLNWTVSNEDATHKVTQDDNGLRYESDTTSPQLTVVQIPTLTSGAEYTLRVYVHSLTSGRCKVDMVGQSAPLLDASSVGWNSVDFTAGADNTLTLYRITADVDNIIREVSIKAKI